MNAIECHPIFHRSPGSDPIQYDERVLALSPAAISSDGWCSQSGTEIPVDFTIAAELFTRSADSNEANGANSFASFLERRQGVATDMIEAVLYCERAASQNDRDEMYSIGRCLEYGKINSQNHTCAAKYDCLLAELNHPLVQNSSEFFWNAGSAF
jgi:TPR repeat protein